MIFSSKLEFLIHQSHNYYIIIFLSVISQIKKFKLKVGIPSPSYKRQFKSYFLLCNNLVSASKVFKA